MQKDYFVESTLSNSSPFPISAFRQPIKGRGVTARSHIHGDIELIYPLGGEFEAYINNDRYSFKKGELLVIDAGDIHSIYSLCDEQSDYIVIRVALDNLIVYGQRIDENKYMLPFIANFYQKKKVFTASEIKTCDLERSMMSFIGEWEKKDYGFELYVKSIVLDILIGILRERSGCNDGARMQELERTGDLAKAFEYIEKNYASDISLGDVAELCSMSYSYFSRLFKNVTSFKFSEYLLRFRLNEAEYRLATTDDSVTDIAYGTGFSSSSYFVSRFKLINGMTPKQYRRERNERYANGPKQ